MDDLSPNTIPAGSIITPTATIAPTSRTIKWVLEDPQPANLGVGINENTGEVTTVDVGGTVTIKAKDSELDGASDTRTLTIVDVDMDDLPSDVVFTGSIVAPSAIIAPVGRTLRWRLTDKNPLDLDVTIDPNTGVVTAGGKCGTVTIRAEDSNLSSAYDTRQLSIVDVELFRDAAYTKPLNDWDADSNQLRSPKYIFGKNDGIYVRVSGLSDAIGYSLVARVQSGQGISPAYTSEDHTLALVVPDGASYSEASRTIFLNIADSSDSTAEWIKTQNDDLLVVELKKGQDVIHTKSVMVDLGEFAAMEGTETPDAQAWYTRMGFEFSDFEAVEFKDNESMTDSAVAALHGNVDIGFVSGHGSYRSSLGGSFFSPNNSPFRWQVHPGDVGSWGGDCEWIVLATCSVLAIDLPAVDGVEINSPMYKYERESNNAQEWGKLWAQTLVSEGRSVHGLLGYRGGSKGDQLYNGAPIDSTIATSFASLLGSGKTLGNAWIEANKAICVATRKLNPQTHYYSPMNAVALMHTENISDKLKEPTADSKNKNFSYVYIQWTWSDDEPGNVELLPNAAGAVATKTFTTP